MRWALVDSENKVINIIKYDGASPYPTDSGVILLQVQDWIEIGNDANAPKPEDTPPLDEATKKNNRDIHFKNDLFLKYCYSNEKKANPNLTFSDFLDNLENLVVK